MAAAEFLRSGLHALGYALIAFLIRLKRAWGAPTSLAALLASQAAAAAPGLRPWLAALCTLPPTEHIGSRPRPPTILGVVVAEDVAPEEWPAAVEALGQLLAWAHAQGFQTVLLYEPTGSLQQQQHLRQLELQLLKLRLCGAVKLQVGWQPHAGALPPLLLQADGAGSLTAVLLAAADGQQPLLAAALAVAGGGKTAAPGSSPGSGPAKVGKLSAGAVSSSGSTVDGSSGAPESGTSSADMGATGAPQPDAIDAAIAAPARVRQRLQAAAGGAAAGAEPDFVLVHYYQLPPAPCCALIFHCWDCVVEVTGPALTLAGFPAWTVRTSEIYGVGPLAHLTSSRLQAQLQRFCATKQRFGK